MNVIFLLKGDVYPVEPYDDFRLNKVLDAHWGVLYDEDVSLQSQNASSCISLLVQKLPCMRCTRCTD